MEQRSTVTFVLNGNVHHVRPVSPTQTLLQYLREHCHLTGTKEGCAEGDCGACTIAHARPDKNGGFRFHPVNACIRFLPTLDGAFIWTVEGVSGSADALHPVQQSLVDHHASQCGFCTPGFVMSLYVLYARGMRHPVREQVVDQLSGNLCRCTGYRPIIDAGLAMGDYPPVHVDVDALAVKAHQLARACSAELTFEADGQSYHAPKTVAELARLFQKHPDAVLLAGGTDVGLWVTKQLRALPRLIYLGDIPELQQISHEGGWIRVGAAVLLEDAYEELTRHYPELTELWKRFASTPIRSSGTLVGNLANGSPIGDTAPILIALRAKVVLRCGERSRELNLEDLYVDYGRQAREPSEFLEAVLIPERQRGVRIASYKLSKRFDQDIAAVCGAYALTVDDGVVTSVRIAYGGMAATTRRASLAEAALLGQPWQEPVVRESMAAMADDFRPLSDMRASHAYRLKAAQNLLYRFFLETGTNMPTRVYGEHHASL